MTELMPVEITAERCQYKVEDLKAKCLHQVLIGKEDSCTGRKWREVLDLRSPFGGRGPCK
jgi:hypothetical protein